MNGLPFAELKLYYGTLSLDINTEFQGNLYSYENGMLVKNNEKESYHKEAINITKKFIKNIGNWPKISVDDVTNLSSNERDARKIIKHALFNFDEECESFAIPINLHEYRVGILRLLRIYGETESDKEQLASTLFNKEELNDDFLKYYS